MDFPMQFVEFLQTYQFVIVQCEKLLGYHCYLLVWGKIF